MSRSRIWISLLTIAAAIVVGAGGSPASASSRACGRETPTTTYTTSAMAMAFDVAIAPCRTGRAGVRMFLFLEIDRCDPQGCTSAIDTTVCQGTSGTCRTTFTTKHPLIEYAQYGFKWAIVAYSGHTAGAHNGETTPTSCLSAEVVTHFC